MTDIFLIALYFTAVWLLLIMLLIMVYSTLLVLYIIGIKIPTRLFRCIEYLFDALLRPGICFNDFLNLLPCYRNRAPRENIDNTPEENIDNTPEENIDNETIEPERDVVIIINPNNNPTLGISDNILQE